VARKPPKQRRQVLRSALAKETQQSLELMSRQCGGFDEARIVAILPGQKRECDAAITRKRRQPLDPVTPPVETAE
jgi:hypothetical protein